MPACDATPTRLRDALEQALALDPGPRLAEEAAAARRCIEHVILPVASALLAPEGAQGKARFSASGPSVLALLQAH